MTKQSANSSVRVVQITDTHLFREPAALLLKMNTQETFESVLELVEQKESSIDLVLGTGDIAQDASLEAYERFIVGIKTLSAPFYWIPGNHDRLSVMASLPQHAGASQNLIVAGSWHIIMLDSSVVGEVHGWLAESELQHLEKALTAAQALANVHVMVCLHHNPVPGNSHWMDGIGLRNAAAFFAVIDRFSSVRVVLYGHIHQTLDFQRDDVRYLCTPSTCIQFKQAVTDFALDDRNPAYRWLDLHPDGSIDTAVERVTKTFVVDHDSTGY